MSDAQPLGQLVGNIWVPVWTIRPGAYEPLEGLEDCMPLWLLLHSRNADHWKPCYASRESLGATIGMGKTTVGSQMTRLAQAHLLFVVSHGVDRRTGQHRPPARWALDPMEPDRWRPKVEERLAEAAERHGHPTRWYDRAIRELNRFEKRSRGLANELEADMPVKPRRRTSKKRRGRNPATVKKGRTAPKRNSGNRLDGATAKIWPSARIRPPGDVSTTGEVVGGRNGRAGTPPGRWWRENGAEVDRQAAGQLGLDDRQRYVDPGEQ